MESTQPTSAAQQAIAYLGFEAFEKAKAYRGALLVVDGESKPLEFRCTAPVHPTDLQRTLYGASLLPHILTDLIGSPLISTAREKLGVIIITDAAFFDVRLKISTPVIRIIRADGKDAKHADGTRSQSLLLQSASGKFDHVMVEAHPKFPADLDSCGDRFRDLFSKWNLLEPFQRMIEGLKYIHDEHVLES